jgi:hypothetical protein
MTSPIAYLFYGDDEPCDIACIRQSEDEAGIDDTQRLCVVRYSELNATRLGGMGRRQPPRGSGPCVIQMIDGERHDWLDRRITEWTEEYIEYLASKCSEIGPKQRSAMGGGKLNVKDIIDNARADGAERAESVQQGRPQSAKESAATKSRGASPDVGATSIQLQELDCFLQDFANDASATR